VLGATPRRTKLSRPWKQWRSRENNGGEWEYEIVSGHFQDWDGVWGLYHLSFSAWLHNIAWIYESGVHNEMEMIG
jgi:hypothetical protein